MPAAYHTVKRLAADSALFGKGLLALSLSRPGLEGMFLFRCEGEVEIKYGCQFNSCSFKPSTVIYDYRFEMGIAPVTVEVLSEDQNPYAI